MTQLWKYIYTYIYLYVQSQVPPEEQAQLDQKTTFRELEVLHCPFDSRMGKKKEVVSDARQRAAVVTTKGHSNGEEIR